MSLRRPQRNVCLKTALAALLVSGVAGAVPLRLQVAPDGRDTWSGALQTPNADRTDGPLATPQRALELITRAKARLGKRFEGATVVVHEGTYRLAKPLAFSPANSGVPQAPVVFRAPRGEKVVLSGGVLITHWTPYRKGIFRADVSGLAGRRGLRSQLLYCNGVRMHLARYPNAVPGAPICGGWAFVAGDPIPMYANVPGDKVTLHIRKADVRHGWSNPSEGEVFIFPRYNWWNNVLPIKSVDWKKRILITARPASFQMRPGDRYFIQGIREELDAPGEWYLDRRKQILYFIPPVGTDLQTATVVMPRVPSLVDIANAGYIRFEGFTMQLAERWGVRARHARDVEIRRCTIRRLGSVCSWNSAAIDMNGTDNKAIGNDIYDVGAKGISLSGGNRVTLAPGNNVADNNYVNHTGVVDKAGFGIRIDGVGNRVVHNYIHDTPREGISWNGNDHLIEFNHVRDTNTEISDTAMINACNGSWVKRGTVIRYNYLNDPIGFGQNAQHKWVSHYFCWAIYLDNWTCGTQVYGNICVRVPLGLCHNHGGCDNDIENNIDVDGGSYQFSWQSWKPKTPEDAARILKDFETYAGTAPYAKYPGLKPMLHMTLAQRYQMSRTRLERNIFYYSAAAYALSVSGLPFDSTVSDYNLFWRDGKPIVIRYRGWKAAESWRKWKAAGFEKHSVVADPRFVDPAHDDYRLKPDSPAWALGFKPIPIDQIGCYKSDDRASWPIKDAPGVREHPLRLDLMPAPPKQIFVQRRFTAPRRKADVPIVIDGDIGADWSASVDFKHGITIRALVSGGTTKYPSYGYIAYDDRYLYVCMRNMVDPAKPLKIGTVWNADDAVEVALRTPHADAEAPIFVLRGFANGKFYSVTDAGAPKDKAEALGNAVTYAAKIQSSTQWCAEWRIPLQALGVKTARGTTFDLNLTCRKTADNQWVMWNATYAVSWKVSRAGIVTLN